MDRVTLYNVYEGEKLIGSYKAQAPATSLAKSLSNRTCGSGKVFSVVEEVFGHVSSREVRRACNGVIACS